jgi:hypothetical protein
MVEIRKVLGGIVWGLFFLSFFIFALPNGESAEVNRPYWVDHPPGDSTNYIRVVGAKTGAKSFEEAKAGAFDDALAQIAKRIMAEVSVENEGESVVMSTQHIRNAEVSPNGQHHEKGRQGQHSVWLLVRYAKREHYHQVKERKKALDLWHKAEQIISKADRGSGPKLIQQAKDELLSFVAKYPLALQSYFQTEHALFRLAEIELKGNNPCGAKFIYGQVVNHSKQPSWREKAKERWERLEITPEDQKRFGLMNLFFGKTVGLACAYELDGTISKWEKMQAEMSRELGSVRAVVSSVYSQLEPQEIMKAVTGESLSKLDGYDLVVVVMLKGKSLRRQNPESLYGYDMRLDGAADITLFQKNSVVFSYNYPKVLTGWGKAGLEERLSFVASKLRPLFLKQIVKWAGAGVQSSKH